MRIDSAGNVGIGEVGHRFTARLNTYSDYSTSGINITSAAGTLAYNPGLRLIPPNYVYDSAGQLAILRLTSI